MMIKRPAFTFIELLIALSLFSVGMVSVLRIFPVNRKYITQSGQTTRAAFAAQQAIETIRGISYDNLSVLPTVYEPAHTLGTGSSDPLAAFTRKTEIIYIDPTNNWLPANPTTTDTGLKKVSVTVSWSESGITRSYLISTFVYDK